MNKGLFWLSQILIWLPVIGLVVGVDPNLVKDIGWNNSYLPLLMGVGIALYYNLIKIIKNRAKRMITVLLVIMILYLQILRASNWFEVGLVGLWLGYLIFKFD